MAKTPRNAPITPPSNPLCNPVSHLNQYIPMSHDTNSVQVENMKPEIIPPTGSTPIQY